MIDIILGNNYSYLVGELSPYAIERIRNSLCFQKKGCEHIEKYQKNEWDGIVRLFNVGERFMTGLLSPLCKALKESNHEFRIIDRRIRIANNFPELEFRKPDWCEERDYQDFTVERSINLTRGILNIGTGGGKTMTVAQLIGTLKVKPFMFYTITKDLLYQAKEVLESCLNCEIGQIGDGIVNIKDINVCTKDAVIYAIHKKDRSFDKNLYKFDSCDMWDEKSLFGESDCERIVNTVKRCAGIYMDECISGNSIVVTEYGEMTIKDAVREKCKYVMTHDGFNLVMSKILNWWDHGVREVLKISFDDSDLICTKDHLIFTKRGWIQACDITIDDEVQCVERLYGKDLNDFGDEKTSGYNSNIIWRYVRGLTTSEKTNVYDIEVEHYHSFFANGILVHNCHHSSARTVQEIMLASDNAYWRYGGTATYAREDGEELVIQGLFGKKIVDISLSYLIKHNWLVPATVFFVPVVFKNMLYRSYPQIYNHCVINNEEVNKSVSDNAQYLASLGKSSLILVSKISHGKNIQKLIPGSLFLTGKDSSKKRNEAIDLMRKGKRKIMIATTLADEGLDIKNLDVVHMVGAGASVTRVPQRIGRVVRKSPGKKYGIAIYYHYCVEYLYQHGLKAKRLISMEPRINVRQVCDIEDLRTQIVKFLNENNSLFS